MFPAPFEAFRGERHSLALTYLDIQFRRRSCPTTVNKLSATFFAGAIATLISAGAMTSLSVDNAQAAEKEKMLRRCFEGPK